MLDMNRIRKEPREVERLLANKGCIVNFDETLALLRDIGFTAVTVLEDGMFVEKPL